MRNRQFRPVPHASQGGFSLIEIILVVVLIGGIVAFASALIVVAVPAWGGTRVQATAALRG